MARSRLVEVTVMLRRPSAAPPTAPPIGLRSSVFGAPETPRTWVKGLGLPELWPRLLVLPGMPPPAPLAIGWPTVAVKYRYNLTDRRKPKRTYLVGRERSRSHSHVGLPVSVGGHISQVTTLLSLTRPITRKPSVAVSADGLLTVVRNGHTAVIAGHSCNCAGHHAIWRLTLA